MFKRIFKHSFPVINTLGYCFQINKFFCFFLAQGHSIIKMRCPSKCECMPTVGGGVGGGDGYVNGNVHAQKNFSIQYLVHMLLAKITRFFASFIKIPGLLCLFGQGGLNRKEIQRNRCNIFSIFIFNKFYLFA